MGIIENFINGIADIISIRQEADTPRKEEKKPEITYIRPNKADFLPIKPAFKSIKLVLILLENSSSMLEEKEVIKKIIQTSIAGGKYIIINYSENITLSQLEDDKQFNENRLFVEAISDKSCLLDVFSILDKIVMQARYTHLYYGLEKAIIKEIEIIGIGRCINNCSKINKIDSLKIFQHILKNDIVSTKYFCLDDKYFVDAASIGFRSIGAIHRSF